MMEKNEGKEVPFWQNEWQDIHFYNLGMKISSKKDFTSEFILFLLYSFLMLMISSSFT